MQVAVLEVQRHEHRGVGAAVDVEADRLVGIEQDGAQRARQFVARAQEDARARRSTRSSNMTSPSSVRCTGHFAAMILSFATWSSVSPGGKRSTSEKRVGQPRSAGVYSHDDFEVADVPVLAVGVHLHRHRGAGREAGGEQLLRARAGVVAALVPRLVDAHAVIPHLDDVTEGLDSLG